MRRFLLLLFLFMGLHGWGQVDTLEFTSRRQVADTVFGLLNQNVYGPALFERSMSEDSLLILQLSGNYLGAASGWSWLQAYSDIAMSYVDSTIMDSDTTLLHKLENFQLAMRDTSSSLDLLKQPFGLLLHNISQIDSAVMHAPESFSNYHSQLKLNENLDEVEIYRKVVLKSAALLELYGEHGYTEGTIVYSDDFISTSPDITIQSIQLNVGNGFQPFSAINNEITYSIRKSYQLGQVAIEYILNGLTKKDTLSFNLTTNVYKNGSHDYYDEGPWESPIRHFRGDLQYCILYGCGNYDEKIRRPILIAPPYRPTIQNPSFSKYYDQFNFKSLLTSLADMGYDVIFIKETPGNRGINHAGGILADFIKFINEKKKEHFPNEDWENVVIGFSAGGQHWRYALKKLEKEHMESGTPHHHTRLYIPFDSPHWGANVPMFAQAVFRDYSITGNPFAIATHEALIDAASKDMLMNHIIGSNLTESNDILTITPNSTTERQNIVFQLDNWFNHIYTPMNDLRRSFPTFTRNVAISVGSNEKNYNNEYDLDPGEKLFSQNFPIPTFWGMKYVNTRIDASWYMSSATALDRKETRMVAFIIPIIRQKQYVTNWGYEWDMAQGGYKDDFYDQPFYSPVAIMRWSALGLGTKHYKDGHMSFLPLVSALGINPSIWQNNNLYYNLKGHDLMYNQYNSNTQSDLYGYPNLAHPIDHFNITPFEAIYCDPQTYQHIKMQQSVDDDELNDVYLVHTRNFILDEVEADVVYLQNKIIGKNHLNWDPNYRYKAWYKAYDKVVFGSNVTPKTDPGAYIIEPTGEITAYACNGVHLAPGFHAQNGSKFHAYTHCDGCSRPRGKSEAESSETTDEQNDASNEFQHSGSDEFNNKIQRDELKLFPNPNSGKCTVVFPQASGEFVISDINGRVVMHNSVTEENKITILSFPQGLYILKWTNNKDAITKKISVL